MNEHTAGGAPGAGSAPSEEELRAQLEAELKRLRVEDVVLQAAVSLLNLGARRAGLAGGEDEVDLGQVEAAIDGVQALLPVMEKRGAARDVRPLRDALAQLQLAYARHREAGAPAGAGTGEPGPDAERAAPSGEPGKGPAAGDQDSPTGPGPAQRSGRLWVPGR
jgi:hypothetical protein